MLSGCVPKNVGLDAVAYLDHRISVLLKRNLTPAQPVFQFLDIPCGEIRIERRITTGTGPCINFSRVTRWRGMRNSAHEQNQAGAGEPFDGNPPRPSDRSFPSHRGHLVKVYRSNVSFVLNDCYKRVKCNVEKPRRYGGPYCKCHNRLYNISWSVFQ